jgi:hypothetical protein
MPKRLTVVGVEAFTTVVAFTDVSVTVAPSDTSVFVDAASAERLVPRTTGALRTAAAKRPTVTAASTRTGRPMVWVIEMGGFITLRVRTITHSDITTRKTRSIRLTCNSLNGLSGYQMSGVQRLGSRDKPRLAGVGRSCEPTLSREWVQRLSLG